MKEYKLSYNGHKWSFLTNNDHMGKSLDKGKPYEFEMLRYIVEKYRGVFVDVGAHHGGHSIFIDKFGDFQVHAFEPVLDNIKILEDNVSLNGSDINTYMYALSSKPTLLGLTMPKGGNNGSWRVTDGKWTHLIRACKLDSFNIPATVIKIDAEGHELEVLKGAEGTIRKHKPVLFIEEDKINDLAPLHKWLKERKYKQGRKFNATPTFEWRHDYK